jgi:hypothetical protein
MRRSSYCLTPRRAEWCICDAFGVHEFGGSIATQCGGDALPNDKARAILDRINYITLATVDERGRPWNAPVYYAYDHAYRVYWGSHVGSQHPRNIRRNAHGFIVVYDSTVPSGTGEGVYIDAHCVELSHPDDIAAAHQVIQARRATPYWTLE